RHKNRPFAIRLLARLLADGWGGRLVLAGGEVAHGSSRADEDRIAAAEDVGEALVRLGPVSEAERRWLVEHCAAVAYPSVDEGFGLLPFEAARAGRPCLFAAVGPLAEMLPPQTATLVPWDAAESARRARPLLTDGEERDRHVAAVRAAADGYRWE